MTLATLYFRGLPRFWKDKFKSDCALRGDTMQDVVEALMRLYADKPQLVDKYLVRIKERKERRKPVL